MSHVTYSSMEGAEAAGCFNSKVVFPSVQDDDSDEIDDFTIRDSDLLLLTARNEDDVSNIEVGGSSLYFLLSHEHPKCPFQP